MNDKVYTWLRRMGLTRESNPTGGPSNEDIARERSDEASRAARQHRGDEL